MSGLRLFMGLESTPNPWYPSRMKLPRGVRLDHGYVQVRLFHDGVYVLCKNFGPVCKESLDAAAAAYVDAKKRIREGTWGTKREARRIKFKEARILFHKRHYVQYRDPSTHQPRTAGSIGAAESCLEMLGRTFDDCWLDEVSIKKIKAYKLDCIDEQGYSAATFNKHRMFLNSMFTQFRAWGLEDAKDMVRLPVDNDGGFLNPCEYVSTLMENKRRRIPTNDEFAKVYDWCQTNEPQLWYGIENALLTALRKSDLVGLTGAVKGTQKKTGGKFHLPLTLEKPVEFKLGAWNRLRDFMGWLPPEEGKTNPNHTTWHDLRHWAPTLLVMAGYTLEQIKPFTGHDDIKSLEIYTNPGAELLPGMLDKIRARIAHIKTIHVKLGVSTSAE